MINSRTFAEALALAVRARKNIIVSGGTSTGKTTFLNALLREVPAEERLILIEDTPELIVEHENKVGLVSVRGELGEAKVTANDLVSASLRMRPDRIILGELRGPEAFAFLRAINTGHPGSMTTIHADSPDGAVEQLVMLVLQGGTKLGRDDVRHYVRQSVDVFVQLSRIGGRRNVEAVISERQYPVNPDLQAPNVFGAAMQWLQGTLLGTIATAVAVIAVASVGFLLMSGRIDVRRGAQVIFGCFVIFGASSIASGLVNGLMGSGSAPQAPEVITPAPAYPPVAAQKAAPATPFDPYAGAALPTR